MRHGSNRLFIPAKSGSIPLIDRIFTRIGAADDLIGGQSTFMVEMKDIQVITEQATQKSLVIIDELGRGTSTGEGMAIAQAVIEYVHQTIGCKALVSTHFHELAQLEDTLSSLTNARMAVEESGDHVTFLRKLVPGAADTSYGIYCAQLGLPQSVIGRAYELLANMNAIDLDDRATRSGSPVDAQSTLSKNSAASSSKPSDHTVAEARGVLQLSMFDEPAASAEQEVVIGASKLPKLHHSEANGERTSVSEAEMLAEQLRKLDLFNLTPMQAMQWLNDMKVKLK